MVLAISFVEAPLKFRAPGITLPLGLGIGRLVFRALNALECVLAAAVLVLVWLGTPTTASWVALAVVGVVLVVQLAVVRPRLNRRSEAVLAGAEGPRSHAHLVYIALECAKVAGLVVFGVLALA
ncbi:hypothetical protein [Crossiella equi]|nr:hypothetical protein [Crossiella equi]